MSKSTIFPATILLFLSLNAKPQAKQEITGVWKGTSICQIKESPCNNENAIYHISKLDSLNQFKVVMNKIVNGQEENMGDLKFTYNPAEKILLSIDQAHNTEWKFKVTGNKIHGTLMYKGSLYRIIDVTKE